MKKLIDKLLDLEKKYGSCLMTTQLQSCEQISKREKELSFPPLSRDGA